MSIDDGRFTVGGREFEARLHTDGTWWLLLWRGARSARIGVYANEEVARGAPTRFPPDLDLEAVVRAPHGAMAAGFAEASLPER